jgi:hypothetical protein
MVRVSLGVLVALGMLGPAFRVHAAKNDWAEGTPGHSDGATRDYYNRGGRLAWKNYLGDWRDARNEAQGEVPYGSATVRDDDTPRWIEWEVTSLVREWLTGKYPNQGMFLRGVKGSGSYHFRSREHAQAKQRPQLVITTNKGTQTLAPVADTYLEPSTYRSQGNGTTLRITMKSNPTLLRFDLSRFKEDTKLDKAVLRLYTFAQYGQALDVGVFRCAQGHEEPKTDPVPGLAAKYPGDRGLEEDPDVLFFSAFETPQWANGWTQVGGRLDPVDKDEARKFAPLQGTALRVKIAEGSTGAMNVTWKFRKQTGSEPEEIYFRYYLRLADDWNQTLQGGKLPGISGTYGIAGWGGRRSNGSNGWSARGAFDLTIPKQNPLAGTTPIGTYCYHADMKGNYGDIWLWQKGYRGFLENNRWYCLEQYLKLNTPGKKDGILRAWVDGQPAFEKTDIRFRLVDKLKIEQIWMNVYHGGTKPSPYDQHLYVDNVVIARKYIGPMKRTK